MIIGVYGTREIGKMYRPEDGYGITDDNGSMFPIPYLVTGLSSEQDWINEQILDDKWGIEERVRHKFNQQADNYYEVSVD